MFLHLREKTKFIRYNRRNRYIPTANRRRRAAFPLRSFTATIYFTYFAQPSRSTCLFQPRSRRFDKFYRLFQFFSKKRSSSVDTAIKRRRVENKSTEFDLRGADSVRSVQTLRLRQFCERLNLGASVCFSPNLR